MQKTAIRYENKNKGKNTDVKESSHINYFSYIFNNYYLARRD